MLLSTRIAGQLPYLRRYARAITGSQRSGDAYVTAMLEALIEDPTIFPQENNDRIATYKLFTLLFNDLHIDTTKFTSPYAWETKAAKKFSSIAPRSRQAFLLNSVEGFALDEIAKILSISSADVDAHIRNALEEISRHIATHILIIEDEPLIAMDIQNMVEELGHNVTGIARTHSEVLKLYEETKPKMILADIQLADGSSGLDAVNDILQEDDIPVIFITAFPERLLTGERPEPTFLVTKPFNPDMVKALITQALFFEEKAQTTN